MPAHAQSHTPTTTHTHTHTHTFAMHGRATTYQITQLFFFFCRHCPQAEMKFAAKFLVRIPSIIPLSL